MTICTGKYLPDRLAVNIHQRRADKKMKNASQTEGLCSRLKIMLKKIKFSHVMQFV